jgi:hypothetical protein
LIQDENRGADDGGDQWLFISRVSPGKCEEKERLAISHSHFHFPGFLWNVSAAIRDCRASTSSIITPLKGVESRSDRP